MSNLRNMDGSIGDTSPLRWIAPPSLPVCEPAQVQHRGEGDWPFLYSYRDGRCYVNSAPRKSAYANAEDVGGALI